MFTTNLKNVPSCLDVKVSFYSSLKNVTSSSPIALSELLFKIRSGYWKSEITRLQTLSGEERKRYKRSLPLFTPSGLFAERKDEGLITHSGLIVIDFDNLKDIDSAWALLIADKYTAFAFRSCGGNGLAVGVKIKGDAHRESFAGLREYYSNQYNLEADSSCANPSRARFISYDPNLFINEK